MSLKKIFKISEGSIGALILPSSWLSTKVCSITSKNTLGTWTVIENCLNFICY